MDAITHQTMKLTKNLGITLLSLSLFGGALLATAADQKSDAKLKPYTLKTCIVSGDKLGEMGDAVVYPYKDREIKFCCKGCIKDFNKDPEKYIKKIEEAEKAAKAGGCAAPAGGCCEAPSTNASAHQH